MENQCWNNTTEKTTKFGVLCGSPVYISHCNSKLPSTYTAPGKESLLCDLITVVSFFFFLSPSLSQHMVFGHSQVLCWFSVVPCISIQKRISVPVIHLELHYFGNLFVFQEYTNIQLEQANIYYPSL